MTRQTKQPAAQRWGTVKVGDVVVYTGTSTAAIKHADHLKDAITKLVTEGHVKNAKLPTVEFYFIDHPVPGQVP